MVPVRPKLDEIPTFYATRSRQYDRNRTFIPYNNVALNVGNGLDVSSGLFTAPMKGIYFISFAALKMWGTLKLCVQLKHNNVTIATRQLSADPSYTFSRQQWIGLNLQSTLLMEVGDTVGVYLHEGVLYDADPYVGVGRDVAAIMTDDNGKSITTKNTVFTGFIVQVL